MKAILNSLNAHNLSIFQLILVILVSKFMVHRALSDKTNLSLGLLSPLMSCSRTQRSDAGEARTRGPWSRVRHSITESNNHALVLLNLLNLASLAFYLFSLTRLINSIKPNYSCKIVYVMTVKTTVHVNNKILSIACQNCNLNYFECHLNSIFYVFHIDFRR